MGKKNTKTNKPNNEITEGAAKKIAKSKNEMLKTFDTTEKRLLDFYKKTKNYLFFKKNKHPYGKSYFWIKIWEKLFELPYATIKLILRLVWKLSYSAAIFAVVFVLIFGTTPDVLSAPQSKTVTTKAEWDMGTFTSVTSDTSQNSIQLQPNGNWTERVLASPRDTISYGSASVMAGNHLYVMRGYSDKLFWRYDTVNNSWETMPDLPQASFYGADMTFLPGVQDGTGKIYAIFGGYSQKFYEFDIATEEWTRLPDLRDSTYTGSSIENDGTDVYFLRGNGSTDFFKYFVNAEAPYWKDLSAVTGTVNAGGDLVYGHDGYMYATRGSNTLNFYRFAIPANEGDMGSWTAMADVTTTYTFANEQRGVYWDSGTGSAKYLYFLRSNGTSTMHRYQITCNDGTTGTCAGEKNTWSVIAEPTPTATNYTSLTYNENDGNFYALRSNGFTDLWKFDPDGTVGQQWLGPKQVQNGTGTFQAVTIGGDLIWNGQEGAGASVFSVTGNSVNFNEYKPSTVSWITRGAFSLSVTVDATGTFNKNTNTIYYPRSNVVNTFDSTSAAPGAWSTFTPTGMPTVSNGGGIIYNGSRYYVTTGGGGATSNYFYDCGTDFATCVRVADLRVDNVNYFPNIGGRMVSAGTYFPLEANSTDIYATIGDGETTFLKYSSGAWSKMAPTPFAQYYGTSLTYYNGKIYALAGYYKDETWEYDISSDKWIKMPDNQKYIYGRGPERGANIEYAGDDSMFATIGMSLPDMWKFSIGNTDFPAASGTYVSEAVDLSNVGSWNGLSADIAKPANTSIAFETMTSADNVTWPDDIPANWDDVTSISEVGGAFSADIASTENRYVKVKITLTSTDGADTPAVYDYTVSYTVSGEKPQNPTEISAASQQTGGTTIESGIDHSYSYDHPFFSWSGATHNGSGIAGYYVCFDTDSNCAEPVTDGGSWSLQTGFTYTANTPLKTGTYHLKIKTKDGNGNVSDDIWDAFTYQYDGVSTAEEVDPLSKTRTSADDFTGGTLDSTAVSGSGDEGSVRLTAASGFWNQNRLSLAPGTIYQAGELALGKCKDDTDVTPPYTFNNNHCLYTMVGNNLTAFYRYEIETDTWSTRAVTPYNTNTGAALVEGPEGYLYAVRGTGNGAPLNAAAFWMYDMVNDVWVDLGNAPRSFGAGSNLSYDGRYIYATPGAEDSFYIYDTCNGASSCSPGWKNPYNPAAINNLDFGNPNSSNGQFTGEGADSVYDGRNNIYMVQGNQFSYFAKYSIANDAEHGETKNTWTTLAPAPEGFSYGGSLTYDSETNTIFAIAGNNAAASNSKQAFLKYDIETSTWSTLPDAPTLITQSGASLSVHDGYIYFLRGSNTNLMYRFNISENSWELPGRGFFGQANPKGNGTGVDSYFNYGAGTFLAPDASDNLYVIRGGYDNTFGRYNVISGAFTDLARLPMGAVDGASLVYGQDENNANVVYYIPGPVRATRTVADTKNPYFYKYIISSDTWQEITDRPTAKTAAGSSMAYDSANKYLYLTQGGNTVMYKYNVNGSVPKWSTVSAVGACSSGAGSKIIYTNSAIYRIQAGGNASFCKFNGTAWSTLKVLPAVASTGASIFDGKDGYIYVARGADSSDYYRYAVNQLAPPNDVWETLSTTSMNKIPANVNTGGVGGNLSNRNWLIPGAGTNTFADGLYSYVIGSSANQTGFSKTGSYTSDVIDFENRPYSFANLTINYVLPDSSSTFLTIETRTSDTGSLDPEDEDAWTNWSAVTNEHVFADKHTFSINSMPERYVQVRISFSSADQIFSPRVDDYSIFYYEDIEQPTGPTHVTAYRSDQKPLPEITNPTDPEHPIGQAWFGDTAPCFEWPAAGEPNGASDNPNPGGSGIAGYYVYFGENAAGEPLAFQEENSFTAPSLNATNDSGKTYYLRVQAVDNAGLPAAEIYNAFVYNFDRTPPTNPTDISVNPLGYSSTDTYTFTWTPDAADASSQVKMFQYRTDGDEVEVWHDIPDPETVSQTAGPYQANKNTFYLRTIDNADNASAAITQDYYWSGGAASPPENLTVFPSDAENTDNSFTLTWDLPASFAGEAAKLKYYYSINALPTAYNTVETTVRAAGPGPFATQYGKNTFYVVALNDGGTKTNPTDIDWNNPAEVDFYAKTTAPGAPLNTAIFDTSDRENAEYSVAVKWSAPEGLNAGNFASYVIYRSLDDITYTEVATTTGTAYVDSDLESQLYYYYVKAKDKTNNYSIASTTVSITPTGRYTSPPTIVSLPKLTLQSYVMTADWSTNRVASSFVEFGKSVALGETNGQVDSVTDHSVVVTGLDAGTKYFYRVKFIDPDGNIGTSEIDNFTTLPPPVISEVTISDILLESAVVSWQTNTSATCTLKSGSNSIEENSGGSNHIQKITGLQPTTTYSIQINCLDSDLNSFSSDEYSFTTPQKPIAADVTVQNEDNVDLPTIVVEYKTNVPTSTEVEYQSSSAGGVKEFINDEMVTEHKAEISGLDPKAEYILTIVGTDANGINLDPVEQKITTRSDSRPPKIITNRAIGRVIGRGNASQANIYIKVETDEATTVKVKYSLGVTSNLEQATAEDPLNTYHLITIPTDPGQVYSYQAEAYDEAGNLTKSDMVTVIVENAKANATEVIAGTFSNRFGWLSNLWNRPATQ